MTRALRRDGLGMRVACERRPWRGCAKQATSRRFLRGCTSLHFPCDGLRLAFACALYLRRCAALCSCLPDMLYPPAPLFWHASRARKLDGMFVLLWHYSAFSLPYIPSVNITLPLATCIHLLSCASCMRRCCRIAHDGRLALISAAGTVIHAGGTVRGTLADAAEARGCANDTAGRLERTTWLAAFSACILKNCDPGTLYQG